MAGRKPVPTALKIVRGNPGKRRLNKREPKPARGIPPVPDGLSDRGRKAWEVLTDRLHRMGVLTTADGHALEMLCESYAEWRDAKQAIAVHGSTTYESETQNGKIRRPLPEVAIAADAWRRLARMLTDFGLTPSARARLRAGDGDDEGDDTERRFFGAS